MQRQGAPAGQQLTATRGASRVKLLAVTPNTAVSPDPRAEPAKDPPLRMDIRVANSVASTPCNRSGMMLGGCVGAVARNVCVSQGCRIASLLRESLCITRCPPCFEDTLIGKHSQHVDGVGCWWVTPGSTSNADSRHLPTFQMCHERLPLSKPMTPSSAGQNGRHVRCPRQRHTSGHSLAARTKTGMNATWPSTVSTTESPSTNSSLLRPSA